MAVLDLDSLRSSVAILFEGCAMWRYIRLSCSLAVIPSRDREMLLCTTFRPTVLPKWEDWVTRRAVRAHRVQVTNDIGYYAS